MTNIPRTQPTGASAGEIHLALKTFIDAQIRIDRWTIEYPATNVIKLPPNPNQPNVLAPYPPNTAATEPYDMHGVDKATAGMEATTDYSFRITYRFPRQMTYDQLPFIQAGDIAHNILYYAASRPAQINQYVRYIGPTDLRAKAQVSHVDSEESDWLVHLFPSFRVTYKTAPGNLGLFQPGSPSPAPILVNSIKLDIHRAYPEDFDPSRLDRSYTFNYNQPSPTPSPSPTPAPAGPQQTFGMNI